jgi:hypothetical protein
MGKTIFDYYDPENPYNSPFDNDLLWIGDVASQQLKAIRLGDLIGEFPTSGTGLTPWIRKAANYQANSGERIIADTTASSFTITFPVNPLPLSEVEIFTLGNADKFNLNLNFNGKKIFATNYLIQAINTSYAKTHFVFLDETIGWVASPTNNLFLFNSPTDYTTLAQWYKADAGVTLVDNKVSDWADQSGNLRTLAQTDATKRFVVAANDINGYPSMKLNYGTFMNTSYVPGSGGNPRLLGLVIKSWIAPPGDFYNGHILHYGSVATAAAFGLWGVKSSGSIYYVGNHYWATQLNSTFPIANQPLVLIVGYKDGISTVWVNGSKVASENRTLNTGTGSGLHVGCRISPAEFGTFNTPEIFALSDYSDEMAKSLSLYARNKYQF